MSIKVYYASVSGNIEMKKQQTHICSVLESKKISFTLVDICQSTDMKNEMRERAGDPKALAPQICNGDIYCGDYAAFNAAVEEEALETFLKL